MTSRDRRSAGNRPNARRIGAILLAMLAAALLAWLIVRNAANQLYDQDAPETALSFWPPSGRALSAVALDQVVAANGIVGQRSRALLEQSLRRAPLLGDPFTLAGLDASAHNQTDLARHLMEEARRRDPRSVIARSWLLDYYLGQGDYPAGLDEVGPLLALESDAQPAILTMVTALVQIPKARAALIAKLRTEPWWRVGFFEQVSTSPSLVAGMALLLKAAPNRLNPAGAAREQQALLQGVAEAGRFQLAYDMWLAQLPTIYRAQVELLYNGDFRAWPGVAPFNWRLHAINDGDVARVDVPDLSAKSALQINSNADNSELVADQLVVAAPGAYRLSFTSRRLSDNNPGAAGLGITIRCMYAGAALASLSFDPPAIATLGQINFNVPPHCPAIKIGVFVRPGESPGPVDAQITGLRLERTSGTTARGTASPTIG